MYFKDIIGQEEASKHLTQAVSEGRIANTQLFLGAPGSGTLLLALAYSRYLLCTNRNEEDACGSCTSCTMIDKLAHPDLHFSFPIILSTKIRVTDSFVEKWREVVLKEPYLDPQDWYAHLDAENKQGIIAVNESANIMRKLQLRAFIGGYKIMLMWMPETMNPAAANKLLKIFEEPSEKTVIILVGNNVEKLLPTVLSRTQIFRVPKLSTVDVAKGLTTFADLQEDERMAIALRSGGDLNVALKEAREQNVKVFDRFRDWMRICFKKDVVAAVNFVDETYRSGKEAQKALLRYGLHIGRQCMVLEHQLDELVLAAGPEKKFIAGLAPFLNSEKVDAMQQELNLAHSHLERNANAKILFMDLTFTLFKLIGK